MQNWSSTENEAMKGYIILATKFLNDSAGEDILSDADLQKLLYKLNRATDELTTEQARNYFLKSDFN